MDRRCGVRVVVGGGNRFRRGVEKWWCIPSSPLLTASLPSPPPPSLSPFSSSTSSTYTRTHWTVSLLLWACFPESCSRVVGAQLPHRYWAVAVSTPPPYLPPHAPMLGCSSEHPFSLSPLHLHRYWAAAVSTPTCVPNHQGRLYLRLEGGVHPDPCIPDPCIFAVTSPCILTTTLQVPLWFCVTWGCAFIVLSGVSFMHTPPLGTLNCVCDRGRARGFG
jgi:hypothetical protein